MSIPAFSHSPSKETVARNTASHAKPFLKWTGGKRLLADFIVKYFPTDFSTYYEPFLGSGAVFFRRPSKPAHLSDLNEDLINLYKAVRDHVDLLIQRLSQLKIDPGLYYRIRAASPKSSLDRAVRFLYLNKTAFNGIYRVNKKGEFNVPFGCKSNTVLCDAVQLRAASALLSAVTLSAGDFENLLKHAGPTDLIYADPPYTTKHNKNGFRRYNQKFFSWPDQERLAEALRAATARGAHVLLSNAHNEDIRKLYPEFHAITVTRPSCIGASASSRGLIQEHLLLSPTLVRGGTKAGKRRAP